MTEEITCPHCKGLVAAFGDFKPQPDPLLSSFRAVCSMHIAAALVSDDVFRSKATVCGNERGLTLIGATAISAIEYTDALIAELNKGKVKE